MTMTEVTKFLTKPSLKQYVSATVIYNDMTNIDKPGIIISLYGPRGGTVCLAELSIEEAYDLHDQLVKALKDMYESTEQRRKGVTEHGCM